MKNVKINWITVLLAFMVSGCDWLFPPDNSGYSGINYVDPVITLTSSPDFSITESGLMRADINSGYMYGMVIVKYTGSTIRRSVRADLSYRDISGNELFSEYTYLENQGYLTYLTIPFGTYVSPSYPDGYLLLIEDLDDWNIDLSEIAEINITFSATAVSATIHGTPVSHDDPVLVYQSTEELEFYVPIVNADSTNLRNFSSMMLPVDSLGRIGLWTYGDLYQTNDGGASYDVLSGDPFETGESARLNFDFFIPGYWNEIPSIHSILYSFEPDTTDYSGSVLNNSKGLSVALSRDEQNLYNRKSRDAFLESLNHF